MREQEEDERRRVAAAAAAAEAAAAKARRESAKAAAARRRSARRQRRSARNRPSGKALCSPPRTARAGPPGLPQEVQQPPSAGKSLPVVPRRLPARRGEKWGGCGDASGQPGGDRSTPRMAPSPPTAVSARTEHVRSEAVCGAFCGRKHRSPREANKRCGESGRRRRAARASTPFARAAANRDIIIREEEKGRRAGDAAGGSSPRN